MTDAQSQRAAIQKRAATAIVNAMGYQDEATKRDEVDWLMHLISTDGTCGCFLTRCEECAPDETCRDWQRANLFNVIAAYDPPELAVRVGEYRVELTPPATNTLARTDLIVEETDRSRNESKVRALMGIPAVAPVPPAPIDNPALRQVPLATVAIRRGMWHVEQQDITPADGPSPLTT
jgi:hypothetical protein